MSAASIAVMLVDDHAIVREGYRALLERQPGIAVVAEAASGEEAYRLLRDTGPDVVVMDLTMPGRGGLDTIGRIRQRDPRVRLLVFTMHTVPEFARQACAAGALGYVTKGSPPEELVRAVQEVHRGRRYLSADIAQALAWDEIGGAHGPLDSLTVREFEVLRMMVDARTPAEIAATLNLSPKTVMNLHYIVKRKLGVKSDIELLRLAARLKLVDLLAPPAD